MTAAQANQAIRDAELARADVDVAVTVAHRRFGESLRGERLRRSVSLREVARRTKLSAAFVSDVERGDRHATPSTRTKLIQAIRAGRGDTR